MQHISGKIESEIIDDLFRVEKFIYDIGISIYEANLSELLINNNFIDNIHNKNLINYFGCEIRDKSHKYSTKYIIKYVEHFRLNSTDNILIADKIINMFKLNLGGIVHVLIDIIYNSNSQYTSGKLYNILYKYDDYFVNNYAMVTKLYNTLISFKNNI